MTRTASLARRAALAVAALALVPASAAAAPTFDGEFSVSETPAHLAAGPDGNIWVALSTKVAKVAPDGSVTEFDPAKVGNPKGIAAGPDGNIWVTQSDGVARFSPADPLAAESFTIAAITSPNGITAGPDGNLWTASGKNVVKIPPANPAGFTPYPVDGLDARGITSGSDGTIWVADFGADRVINLTTAGVAIPYPTGEGGIQEVAAGPGGQVAYTNPSVNPQHVGRILPGGKPLPTITDGRDPFGITFGPDGAYWFAEFSKNAVGRMTVDGKVTHLEGLAAGSGPRYLTAGPNHTLWVSLEQSKEILRVSGVEAPPKRPLPPPDTVAPAASRVSASARRVRFTISEPAKVRVKVRRIARGKRRLVRSLSPPRALPAGANRVRMRVLRPGRYVLKLSATDSAGNASATRLRFRVGP